MTVRSFIASGTASSAGAWRGRIGHGDMMHDWENKHTRSIVALQGDVKRAYSCLPAIKLRKSILSYT